MKNVFGRILDFFRQAIVALCRLQKYDESGLEVMLLQIEKSKVAALSELLKKFQ